MNAQYNYYISSNSLLDERDKAENLEITGAATTSCLGKKIVKLKTNPVLCKIVKLLSNVTYSTSHRQTGAPMINTQSTLCTVVQMFHSRCYLLATVIHKQSIWS